MPQDALMESAPKKTYAKIFQRLQTRAHLTKTDFGNQQKILKMISSDKSSHKSKK